MSLDFEPLKAVIMADMNSNRSGNYPGRLNVICAILNKFWNIYQQLTAWQLFMAFTALSQFEGTPVSARAIDRLKVQGRRETCKDLARWVYEAYNLDTPPAVIRKHWNPIEFAQVWLQIADAIDPHAKDLHDQAIRERMITEARELLKMHQLKVSPGPFTPPTPAPDPNAVWRKVSHITDLPADGKMFLAWHKTGIMLMISAEWTRDAPPELMLFDHDNVFMDDPIFNQGFTHWRPLPKGPDA